MPSGRVHNLINIGTYSALAAAALYADRTGLWPIAWTDALGFSAAFLIGTFLLSPDLDLATGRVDSKRRWGLLGFIWVPYGRVFSHRGLSHSWVLGPLTRLGYLALLLALLFGLAQTAWPELRRPLPALDERWLWPVVAGYFLSQWLHLMADGVGPGHGWRHLRGRRSRSR
ncbi:metal-binding protein [Deinococcus lacus]|uniref:Metal-binding protein n=1 Tax=Deinococcus lacus TaxID=392561 RepID=A0ABW1Y9V4_9DEIO